MIALNEIYAPPLSDFKWCTKGQHHMLKVDFTPNRRSHDGLSCWCRPCHTKYMATKRAIEREAAKNAIPDRVKFLQIRYQTVINIFVKKKNWVRLNFM
jgi:hypothetical protein